MKRDRDARGVRRRGDRGARARSGVTLVELTLAFVVLTISMAGIGLLMASSYGLKRTNHDTVRATEAALSQLQVVKSEVFSEVFARFNATAADDPAVGSSPGMGFDVRGLEPNDLDPDGFVGRIEFPGNGTTLREDFVDRDMGMPRDLNGDGKIDGLDHSVDYIVLPVRVHVEWMGGDGSRTESFVTTLSEN